MKLQYLIINVVSLYIEIWSHLQRHILVVVVHLATCL